jgi:diguanylate cyclase (GGDEF)-like protein
MSDHNYEFIQGDVVPNSPETSRKIESSLITFVYKQASVGFLASLFCSTIIFFGLYSPRGNNLLLLWYFFYLFVIVFRSVSVSFFIRDPEPVLKIKAWKNLFIFGAALGGLSWGLTAFLLPHYDSFQQILILLVVAGTCAGAVPFIAGILMSCVAFLVAALLPIAISTFLLNHEGTAAIGLTILAFLLYLLVLSYKNHRLISHSIALQFENVDLLKGLTETKYQMEIINKKLEQAATHDPLTNVANRNLFTANFSVALRRAKENKKMVALLYIDLDGFKQVNDIYGHYVGDQLLLRIIDRLEYVCKKNDIISRLGGDEFTIVIEDVESPQEVGKLTERLCRTISNVVKIDEIDIKVSASIGISIYPIDGEEAEVLLLNADRSMYKVKERGGNNYLFNFDFLTE